jgi:hypothetical protein
MSTETAHFIVAEDEEPATGITEYNPITAALAQLKGRYHQVVYDISTTKGMKDALAARAEIRGYRVSLEAKRKEIKAPALERCRAIDSVAKKINEELVAIEEPIDLQIKAEERRKQEERERKEMEERERIARIMDEINRIHALGRDIAGKSSDELLAAANRINELVLAEEFFGRGKYDGTGYYGMAEQAKAAAYGNLMAAHLVAKNQEEDRAKIEAERAELARLRLEQEAREAEISRLKAEAEARERMEQERIRKEREADEARLRAEREAEEARARSDREIERAKIEAERKAEEQRLAEIRRRQEDEARKQAEEQARLEAEKQAIEEEKARQEAEKKARALHLKKLKAARRDDPKKALADIWSLAEDVSRKPDHAAVRHEIAIIAEASL